MSIDTAALRALAERAKQTWEAEPHIADAWFAADDELHTAIGGLFVHDTILALLDEIDAGREALSLLEDTRGMIYPENAVCPGWNGDGYHEEVEGWANDDTKTWHPTLREAIAAYQAYIASAPEAVA